MVFSDLFFLYLFLPIVLILYFANKKTSYKNVVLTIFSLVFYSFGEPIWVCLLIISSLVDYLNGLFIEKYRGKPIVKLGIVITLVFNLGLLAVFKYSGFFVENINSIFNISMPVPGIRLPIGISFFTFQTISYSLDVYRNEVPAQRSFTKFLLYVSLFPQLIAGPIVRYSTIAEQIDNRKTSITQISEGLTRFLIGLGKKVILANTLGGLSATALNGNSGPESIFGAWFGVIMFSLQIFFDFSGYSDMAIGLGKVFGFEYLENFNYPYISKSATEFWRRWHISLGSFFRDYLYIPLGGNRKRMFLNLFIVWFLTGLWHGSSWNFVIWGLYYGFFIMLEKLFLSKVLNKIPSLFSHIYLILLTIFGWAIFYFTDFSELVRCLKTMLGLNKLPFIDEISKTNMLSNIILIGFAIIFSTPIMKIISDKFDKNAVKSPLVYSTGSILRTVTCLLILVISSILLVGESYNPFLYFRF